VASVKISAKSASVKNGVYEKQTGNNVTLTIAANVASKYGARPAAKMAYMAGERK
jgi:hypothetical protein